MQRRLQVPQVSSCSLVPAGLLLLDSAHFYLVPTLNSLCGSEELFICFPIPKLASLFCLWLPAAVALHGEEVWEATPAGLLGLLEEKHLFCQVVHTKNIAVSYFHSVYPNSSVVHSWFLCTPMFSVAAEAGKGWRKV